MSQGAWISSRYLLLNFVTPPFISLKRLKIQSYLKSTFLPRGIVMQVRSLQSQSRQSVRRFVNRVLYDKMNVSSVHVLKHMKGLFLFFCAKTGWWGRSLLSEIFCQTHASRSIPPNSNRYSLVAPSKKFNYH